jgi:hypothetical protein
MNQSPRIKGGDANPKPVENQRAKVVADRGTLKGRDGRLEGG